MKTLHTPRLRGEPLSENQLVQHANLEHELWTASKPAPQPSAPAQRGAIVIGGTARGLGVVRSLGRHGIPVWVLTNKHEIAAASRYSRHSEPWTTAGEDEQLDYLLSLADKKGLRGWALYPTEDEDVALIGRHHDTLATRFLLTTPPWDTVRWAYDKRLTHSLAEECGVDHPWTRYPGSREEVEALDCAFPAILKPAIKEGDDRFTFARAWRVENRRDLLRRYDEACRLVDPGVIMVQELIPGDGQSQFSYAALCVDGRPLASTVARRLRQYPVDFGRASTYVETIDRPELEDLSRPLLAAIGYTGIVELEFKRDPHNGSYKLLDINMRAWGWHTLCRRAGVDYPYLLWLLVHGKPVPKVHTRPGVRWIRMATDVLAAAQGIRRGQLTPVAYVRSLRGPLEPATFALDDPVPALMEVALLAKVAWERGHL